MAAFKARTANAFGGVICVVVLVTACGSGTAAPQPPPAEIAGASSCPAAERQDLTFSGALTGHLSCSTSPAACATRNATPSLLVPLNARLGSRAVQLIFVFSFWREGMKQDQPGIYAAGKLGDGTEPGGGPYGATLDGDGHWETATPAGSMTLSTDDAGGASGAVDLKLTNGAKSVAVAGTWRCVRSAGA